MFVKLKKLQQLFPRATKVKFGILLFLMLIGTILELMGIGAIPAFLSTMVSPQTILQIPVIGSVFTYYEISNAQELLLYAGLGLLLVYIIKNAYLSLLYYIKSKFIRDRKIELAQRMFTAYMLAPYAFHLDRNTAELLRNANLEVRIIGNEVLNPLLQLILNGITAIAITTLLLIIEPVISLIVVSILGVASLLFMRLTRHRMEAMGEEEQRQRTVSYKVMHEAFGSLKAVKILKRELYFIQKFLKSFYKANQAQHVKEIMSSWTRPFMEVMAVIGMLLVAFSTIYLGKALETLVPTLGLFGIAILKLQASITAAVSNFTMLKYSNYSINPVYDDLKILESSSNSSTTTRQNNTVPAFKFNNQIDIESLFYRYHDSDEFVLKDINLTIPNGSSAGIVGPTGAGKSTLIDILLGLLQPTNGQLKVDGESIYENMAGWQANIGYIPQDIYLLDDSIKRNIALGIQDEAIDEDQLKESIRMAQIKDLVNNLPDGWDTAVGERGVRLSGGQLQRVGIARALYHNPDILVMDEATSSLDTSTEKSVMQALNRAKKGRTFIMIAHRLSTVKNCDQIYLLKEGKLLSSGTYHHLAEKSKEFQQMIADIE
jgi:ATP-binding cassette subfamily C protein